MLSIMSVNYSLVKYENKMGKNAGERWHHEPCRRLPSRLRRKEPRPSTSRRRRRRARRPRALILAPALQALALRIQAAPNQAVET